MTFDPIAAAQRVEGFLADPTIQQVFAALDTQFYQRWADAKDVAERERIHAAAAGLRTFRSAMQAIVDAGLHAAAQERIEKRSE